MQELLPYWANLQEYRHSCSRNTSIPAGSFARLYNYALEMLILAAARKVVEAETVATFVVPDYLAKW